MPEIRIPAALLTGLQVLLAFGGAFFIALWISLIVWTFRDVRARSRDIFAIILATLMVVIFGPFGLLMYFLLRPPTTLAELYERSLEEEALLQDLEERPRCYGCGRQVDSEWIVCPDCHTMLKKTCPSCNRTLNLAWDICPFCASPTEKHQPPQPHHEGQRPEGQRPDGQPHPHPGGQPQPKTERTQPMTAPVPTAEELGRGPTPAAGHDADTRPQVPQQAGPF